MKLPFSTLFSSSYFSLSFPLFVSSCPCFSSGGCCVTALVLCENGAPETSKQLVLSLGSEKGSEQQSGIDLYCSFPSVCLLPLQLMGFSDPLTVSVVMFLGCPSVRASNSHEHNSSGRPRGNFLKFWTKVHSDSRMN